MKASIGRMVHYSDDSGCNAAVIIDVDPDPSIVDLQVFHKEQGGGYYREIHLDPADPDGGNRNNHWHWPERVDE